MDVLINRLKSAYPQIKFKSGDIFMWSPTDATVYYININTTHEDAQQLLHELSHAVLDHKQYTLDAELITMEVEAWNKATEIAKSYGIVIDQSFVDECLDTYRTWLYKRSHCPKCKLTGIQDNTAYTCPNCHASWQVSQERFCRPYRKQS